jgi:ligand-binding sensor domain-containing protein
MTVSLLISELLKIYSRIRGRLLSLISLLALCLTGVENRVSAQPYNVTNYRWEQGFTATTGYCLFQDSKGYLWISTENGLMRFNGYDFKMFTTRDGLPDNEILGFGEDKEKRLWVLPFANSIAYIQNGKVFNPANDSILKHLVLETRPLKIIFDNQGSTWINEIRMMNRVTADGAIQKIKTEVGPVLWLGASGQLLALDGNNFYYWHNSKLTKIGLLPFTHSLYVYYDSAIIYDLEKGKLVHYTIQSNKVKFSRIHNAPRIRLVLANTQISANELMVTSDHGAYIYDLKKNSLTDSFLLGYKVGCVVKTKDGAIWFGTAGKGIFRFLSTPVKAIKSELTNPSVIYIKGTDDGMHCNTDKSVFIEVKFKGNSENYKTTTAIIDKENENTHYYYEGQNKQGRWISCAHRIFLRNQIDGKPVKSLSVHVKVVLEETPEHLLIGTTFGMFRLDKERFRLLDTFLYPQRVTAIAKIKDVIYAGTLNSLIACYPDKRYVSVLNDTDLLKSHITALCTGKDDMLWAANGNAELVGMYKDKLVTVFNLKNGLQCNRISSLKASDKFIWVGTDNGLFAITQQPPYNIVRHITYATGLNSNQVNCLDVHKKRIWVGTINGVNYFDEDDVFKVRDNTEIIVNSIKNGDSILTPSKETLQLSGKTLSVDFDVVDFSGGSRPVFQYKISDNSDWVALEGNHLNFPALPYGEFTLTLRAFSPNWAEGALFRQAFYNPPPFYRTWWFVFTTSLGVIIIVLFIAILIIKRFRKSDKKKLQVQQNLLMLEQMALQGQMNPHFIFNCIAAIKQYYAIGDTQKADSFVDAFSLLIRQTFEMGTEIFISLYKELNYLTQYLIVEKTRFNDSFQYEIEVDIEGSGSRILVPAMLLQPIIENAVRHGVRHLPDGEGKITIRVVQRGEQVSFVIIDNGIGRLRSETLKTLNFLKPLTSSTVNEKRVHILNKLFAGKINMHTEDLYTDGRLNCGTKVMITYPVNINELKYNESNHS